MWKPSQFFRHCISLGGVLLGLGFTAGWSEPIQRPQVIVPFINTSDAPIAIDGAAADWTSAARAHPIHFYSGDAHPGSAQQLGTTVLGSMTGRADGETTITLAHDGEWLYLLAMIADDQYEPRAADHNSNEAWREDCLHIYIDSTNARQANIPDPPISHQVGYEQFGVSTDLNCYTENCDFTSIHASGAAPVGAQPDQQNWKVAVQALGSGPYTYIFEERMPLKAVPGHNLRTMQPGSSYGFNAEFCDSDSGVYLQGWVFWSSDGSQDAWNLQNLWGEMLLEAIPNRISGSNWNWY